MLCQLIYGSSEASPFDEDALLELLRRARANNSALGVTGMLLYAEGSFLQVLEGETAVVQGLFEKIARDPRHGGTRVLLKSLVEERTFGDWSMGFQRIRSLADLPEGLSLFLQRGARDDEEEDAALRALSAFRDGRWRNAG